MLHEKLAGGAVEAFKPCGLARPPGLRQGKGSCSSTGPSRGSASRCAQAAELAPAHQQHSCSSTDLSHGSVVPVCAGRASLARAADAAAPAPAAPGVCRQQSWLQCSSSSGPTRGSAGTYPSSAPRSAPTEHVTRAAAVPVRVTAPFTQPAATPASAPEASPKDDDTNHNDFGSSSGPG